MAETTDCADCNPLLDSTPTTIPLPIDTDCPEQDCPDILPATCISVTNQDDCITNGDNLQELIDNIRDFICNNKNPNCKVSITNQDSCCQYLKDAITSDSLDITVEGSGCQKLNIEEKCFTWNYIYPSCAGTGCYRNGWSNLGDPYQLGQYSNEKECSVRLRGTIRKDSNQTFSSLISTIFILPVSKRPLKTRTFSVNIFKTDHSAFTPAVIKITPIGEVTVYAQLPVNMYTGLIGIGLDSIVFELD